MRSTEMPKQAWRTRLDANDSAPKEEPGITRQVYNPTIVSNAGAVTPIGYGPCTFKYVRAKAALASYTIASMPVGTDIDNVTAASSTTQATTTSLTANDLLFALAYIHDNASGAAAPEQETVMIVANTTTQVIFDVDTPLSATLEVNDDIRTYRWAEAEAGASGDTAEEVQGIVIGDINASTTGLTSGYWGWVFAKGIARKCLTADSLTIVERTAFKAAASAAITLTSSGGGDTAALVLGHWIVDGQSSMTTDYQPVFIDVLDGSGRLAPLGA